MISFFFASMVALSFSGYRGVDNTTISNFQASQILYDNDNQFIGYRFDNADDDYQCWDYDGEVKNVTQYKLITGVGDVTYQIICDYGATAGSSTESYVSFKFKVVGESASTNLYLTDFRFMLFDGVYTFDSYNLPSLYFNGQANYYEDGDSGDFVLDIPHSFSNNANLYLDFSIKCLDHTLLEGQWYNNGYTAGYNAGNTDGYNTGYSEGYSVGYTDGYNQGFSTDSTVTSIFSGILQVALVPINFFLAIFNFEILGINLSGFIRALFTIAITIIVIRTIFGGKGASDS